MHMRKGRMRRGSLQPLQFSSWQTRATKVRGPDMRVAMIVVRQRPSVWSSVELSGRLLSTIRFVVESSSRGVVGRARFLGLCPGWNVIIPPGLCIVKAAAT